MLRAPDHEQQISSLELAQPSFPITFSQKSGKLKPFIQIKGTLNVPGTKLYVEDQNKRYPIVANPQFLLSVFLNSAENELKLLVELPDGTQEKEKLTIIAPKVQEIRFTNSWGKFNLYLGSANLKYSQTRYGEFASTNMMLGFAYQSEPIFKVFQFHTTLDATFWTLHATPVNSSPQMLRANVFGTFSAASNSKKIHYKPLLGIQYLTIISNASQFGFSSLISPEIGLNATYDLNPKELILFHFIYIPLGSFLSTSEIGYDFSVGYSRLLENRHYIEFILGNTNDRYQATQISTVSAGYLYFKIGYSI